ncbi:MAG TPA: zf-HC2 domain-containing protein [Vicinamibacterales bacterium]|jgi:anti-sigma factor RsiW|nr:zf-HC2 domain-containing protein [Vicinamibacterales bacterium]
MSNCRSIDPLVTPYVDEQLPDADRDEVERHVRACPPCRSRVEAERAVHELIHARKADLSRLCAPDALRGRCTAHARLQGPATDAQSGGVGERVTWRTRIAPLALAASLVLIVGAAFVYQLTAASPSVMAAELAADHVKCFALNGVLHTHEAAATVEGSMLRVFDWRTHVPTDGALAGLELVGSRPCVYGEGKIAHIMYRHNGEPVSLFMLPGIQRPPEVVRALGHEAAIWCDRDRTFVLVAREPRRDVEQMASLVQASMR